MADAALERRAGRSKPVNRVATWILGSISGLLLAYGALTLTFGAGYGMSSGCESVGDSTCTPVVQQLTVSLPPSVGFFGGAALIFVLLAFLIGLPAWIATPVLAARRGSSARTAILVVSVLATALLIVSIVGVTLSASTALSAPQVCLNNAGPGPQAPQTCFTGSQAFWVALLGIGWGSLAMVLLVSAPAWVMTLTQTARRRQWGWFIAALLFSPVAALLYAFFGAAPPPSTAAPASPAAPAPAPAL
jgi:hypothetical protein